VTGYGLALPNSQTTSTAYDDQNRTVRVLSDNDTTGRVSQFNELGELYLDRQNTNDATTALLVAGTVDIRTFSVERIEGSARYSLTSNPYLSDGVPQEPTLGWTMRKFDQAGRLAEVSWYAGQAKPFPFDKTTEANSRRTGCETYDYAGPTTTVTSCSAASGVDCKTAGIAQSSRSTSLDALGRIASASDGVSTATYGYDGLDNLMSVSMTDGTNYTGTKTQTRSFDYSSLGQLVSATNPELDCSPVLTIILLVTQTYPGQLSRTPASPLRGR